jgi:hypothetical protein
MFNDEEVRQVAERARRVIGEYGWCRGDLRDADGHYCLMGAVYRAATELRQEQGRDGLWRQRVIRRLCSRAWNIIRAEFPCADPDTHYHGARSLARDIEDWNDFDAAPEHVLAVLEKTAAG